MIHNCDSKSQFHVLTEQRVVLIGDQCGKCTHTLRHTHTDTESMNALLVFPNALTHTPPLSLKKLAIIPTMHCLHLFTSSHLPKVTISVCHLPRSFTLHGRDSLIKEQHYLRAAALLAVRNALCSVLCQERKRACPRLLLLTLLLPVWPILSQ